MMESTAGTTHLEPARVDAARRAKDRLVEAAARWSGAAKTYVGAVVLPRNRSAALAFDAFFAARRELARHVGGQVAAEVAEEALAVDEERKQST